MTDELSLLSQKVEEVIGHAFKGIGELAEALTHRSFVNESNDQSLKDNERYEFLGDAVLQLVVSDILMHEHPGQSEGVLSKYRSSIVNERSLAQIARTIDLGSYIRLGRGEELTQGRRKDSILANAFEALLAAIYLAGGLEDASRFFRYCAEDILSSVSDPSSRYDAKTALQEMTQRVLRKVPYYRLVFDGGPDHDKVFESEVVIDERVYGRGKAKSKKDSEQICAAEALKALEAEIRINKPEKDGD